MILQCPKCSFWKDWSSDDGPPGYCICNAWAPWKVLKEEPKVEKGFVRVLTENGWLELTGPDWSEKNGKKIKI